MMMTPRQLNEADGWIDIHGLGYIIIMLLLDYQNVLIQSVLTERFSGWVMVCLRWEPWLIVLQPACRVD